MQKVFQQADPRAAITDNVGSSIDAPEGLKRNFTSRGSQNASGADAGRVQPSTSANDARPSLQEIKAAYDDLRERVKAVQSKYGSPVMTLFSEFEKGESVFGALRAVTDDILDRRTRLRYASVQT